MAATAGGALLVGACGESGPRGLSESDKDNIIALQDERPNAEETLDSTRLKNGDKLIAEVGSACMALISSVEEPDEDTRLVALIDSDAQGVCGEGASDVQATLGRYDQLTSEIADAEAYVDEIEARIQAIYRDAERPHEPYNYWPIAIGATIPLGCVAVVGWMIWQSPMIQG